ncbi:thymidine kinase [Actinomycetaceae bacterium L2_0104]
MAELVFYSGTMNCGKSTLALQTAYNYQQQGQRGLIFTRGDREGSGVLSSRIGLKEAARDVEADTDFWKTVVHDLTLGYRVDFLICDEVQFYTAEQVEQLARIVDEIGIDVYGFGITSDFLTRLFPGSARMIELADRVEVLQVRALCWCGKRATHNARTVGGVMVTEGEQVVIGDTDSQEVGYEVLCRYHHVRHMTAATAKATMGPEPLRSAWSPETTD